MKPAWKTELKDPRGKALTNGGKDNAALTLEALVYDLLMVNDPRAELSGGVKLKNARLAARIIASEDAEINIDEAKIIKDVIGKYASPAAVLAVENLLDPKVETATKE